MNFFTRNPADTAWIANGWSVQAKIYERVGLEEPAGRIALNANPGIHASLKPIDKNKICGVTTFLFTQLLEAKYGDYLYARPA